jgi:orotidine-5'-phosphate decarboxylase
MKPHQRLFVALDTPDAGRARSLARALAGRVGGLKIGLELFTAHGPDLVRELGALGVPVFLDLKLHDIPNTVAGAAAAAAETGAAFLTVHALGGAAMMGRAVEAASKAAARAGKATPTVLAVTVLTSHGEDSLAPLGIAGPAAAAVSRLVAVAREAGAGGIVCSPREVAAVREQFPEALRVVPGIRLPGSTPDDQARTATPGEALSLGADLLVVGRPITASPDPVAAVEAIVAHIAQASAA